MLFNIFERRFNIFGFPFLARFLHLRFIYDRRRCLCDFVYNFGRIFCGWICPQTIFLEMVLEELNIG
jgi:polyferredoxin